MSQIYDDVVTVKNVNAVPGGVAPGGVQQWQASQPVFVSGESAFLHHMLCTVLSNLLVERQLCINLMCIDFYFRQSIRSISID